MYLELQVRTGRELSKEAIYEIVDSTVMETSKVNVFMVSTQAVLTVLALRASFI